MAARTNKANKPVKILIAAMGGEGGGVLTSWLVNAARALDLPVQATSVPGVAQRTGATSYYVEIVPTPRARLKGREPVLDLYPAPGDIDLMIATELLETGRVLEKGFVDPKVTTLIASTHRVYSLSEKMAMSDGRYGNEKVIAAAESMAKRAILFDIDRVARDVGCILNSVILGAMSGSDLLPIPAASFEQGIRDAGKAVEANLAGFAAGRAYAQGKIVEAPTTKKAKTKPSPVTIDREAEALRKRIDAAYPGPLRPLVMEAAGRCLDFQDARYAGLYLDRLDRVHGAEAARGENELAITEEAARQLALRMTYEDVIRVAQLKTRASRFERVRREVKAAPEQLVRVTEFLKPGPGEFAQIMPAFLGRPVANWARRNPEKARRWHFGMHIRSDTIFGFLRLRMMAGMRRMRRIGFRYGEEQQAIEAWIELLCRAVAGNRALALEVARCAKLIKGYGDTHTRGTENFAAITAALIEPAIGGAPISAVQVAQAREAALADPEGNALAKALAEITGATGGREAAE
ncbi:MAG: indolepyruvate oxidoreductase subunit beta family protein [Alphaproteobacteria bacterium]